MSFMVKEHPVFSFHSLAGGAIQQSIDFKSAVAAQAHVLFAQQVEELLRCEIAMVEYVRWHRERLFRGRNECPSVLRLYRGAWPRGNNHDYLVRGGSWW